MVNINEIILFICTGVSLIAIVLTSLLYHKSRLQGTKKYIKKHQKAWLVICLISLIFTTWCVILLCFNYVKIDSLEILLNVIGGSVTLGLLNIISAAIFYKQDIKIEENVTNCKNGECSVTNKVEVVEN